MRILTFATGVGVCLGYLFDVFDHYSTLAVSFGCSTKVSQTSYAVVLERPFDSSIYDFDGSSRLQSNPMALPFQLSSSPLQCRSLPRCSCSRRIQHVHAAARRQLHHAATVARVHAPSRCSSVPFPLRSRWVTTRCVFAAFHSGPTSPPFLLSMHIRLVWWIRLSLLIAAFAPAQFGGPRADFWAAPRQHSLACFFSVAMQTACECTFMLYIGVRRQLPILHPQLCPNSLAYCALIVLPRLGVFRASPSTVIDHLSWSPRLLSYHLLPWSTQPCLGDTTLALHSPPCRTSGSRDMMAAPSRYWPGGGLKDSSSTALCHGPLAALALFAALGSQSNWSICPLSASRIAALPPLGSAI
ncbi:hypothetical protein C8R46DRAFT_424786 [Mycena filopes]|nr:hypothetical protein C8R46DRAFT_424786 [Mycena filopes]